MERLHGTDLLKGTLIERAMRYSMDEIVREFSVAMVSPSTFDEMFLSGARNVTTESRQDLKEKMRAVFERYYPASSSYKRHGVDDDEDEDDEERRQRLSLNTPHAISFELDSFDWLPVYSAPIELTQTYRPDEITTLSFTGVALTLQRYI
jgi:hypothetical protein